MIKRGLLAAGFMIFASAGRHLGAQVVDSVWTISAGSYAGTSIPIDRALAHHRGSKFWRLSSIGGERRIVGWHPSRLPIAVAFRDGHGVTDADSVAFWNILARFEADLGLHIFRPVTLTRGSDPEDVIVIDIKPAGGRRGRALVTWSSYGWLSDARVEFSSRAVLHDDRLVTHEMMHALGFGHTSAWHSVMNARAAANNRLTPYDVAYAQVAIASRTAHERIDMWERLSLAIEREPRDTNAGCEIPGWDIHGDRFSDRQPEPRHWQHAARDWHPVTRNGRCR